jgi:hypothetical protein
MMGSSLTALLKICENDMCVERTVVLLALSPYLGFCQIASKACMVMESSLKANPELTPRRWGFP